MFAVFQVEQGPELAVSLEDDVAATAAIASVRASLGIVLAAEEMYRSRPSVSGAETNFDVVYKVLVCQFILLYQTSASQSDQRC
jgi:hypothetical protein